MPYSPVLSLITHTHTCQNFVPSKEVWLGLFCERTKKKEKLWNHQLYWTCSSEVFQTPKPQGNLVFYQWNLSFCLPHLTEDRLNTERAHTNGTSDSHQQTASFCTPCEEERQPQAEPTVESYMCRSLDRKKNDTWTENRWCSIGSWAWGSIALFPCVCLNHLGTPKTGTGVDFCCTIILDKS